MLPFKYIFYFFFFTFAGVFSKQLYAQNPVSKSFTTLEGLPSNTVYYVFQDHLGYIWFATDKGIVKYNGKELKTFTTADGLSDNEFFDIYEDSQHRIWFASFNGEPTFYQDGVFYTSQNCAFMKGMEFKGPALKIMEDRKGTLYYLTHYEVYALNRQNKFDAIPINSFLYSSLFKDENGKVYALSANKQRVNKIYNLTDNKLVHTNYAGNSQINSKTLYDKFFVLYNIDTVLFQVRLDNRRVNKIEVTPNKHTIHCINKVESNYWIGCAKGVYVSNDFHFEKGRHYFKDYSISCVLRDVEGNIWLSSINKGVLQIPKIEAIEIDEKYHESLSEAYSIHPINNSTIFAGFENNQFALLDTKSDQFLNRQISESKGIAYNAKLYQNKLYIASNMQLAEYTLKGEKLRTVQLSIKDFVIKNDTVWVVGGGGLVKIPLHIIFDFHKVDEKKRESWVQYSLKAKGIVSYKNGYLLFGLFGVKFFQNGKLSDLKDSPLLKKNVTDIQVASDGSLWISSTVNGLLHLTKHSITQYTIKDGLPTNYINAIHLVNSKTIYIATLKGLVKINVSSNTSKIQSIHTYTVFNGLPSDEVNDCYVSNGKLYVATAAGFGILPLTILDEKTTPPKIQLDQLYVNNQKFPYIKQVVLDPDQNSIRLFFHGTSYRSQGQYYYKYRFIGIDKIWNKTQQNKLDFAYLDHGKYILQICCVDLAGNESKPLTIQFQILPHFYETFWFYVIIGLIFAVIVFVVVKQRVQKIRANAVLKQRVLELENENLRAQNSEMILKQEFTELEQKALMLQMNPHFIFNSINSIQGLYSVNKEKADEYLILFSNLLRQILEFSKKELITLDQEVKFLSNYLTINQLRFDNPYEFHIEVSDELIPEMIEIAPLIIQPFVENSLIHALPGLAKIGFIKIRFHVKDDYLICEVEDNGIGRVKSARIQENKLHKSLGMEITEKRLNNFNNRASSIEIEDLYSPSGEALGTKIRIYFSLE